MEVEATSSGSELNVGGLTAKVHDGNAISNLSQSAHEDPSDTELSQSLFYEGVKKMIARSEKRKDRRRTACKNIRKRSKMNANIDDALPIAYSRCSVPYFCEVVKSVLKNPQYTNLVRNMSFGDVLKIDDCYVPRAFAQWVAEHTVPGDEAIVINGRTIPLNEEAVRDVLNIPRGNLNVEGDEEAGKMQFLALFGLSEVPPIAFFGNKIITESLEDAVFCRCFLTVCLSTFLCPNSNTKPSTKYMGALVNVDRMKELNWCKFVHAWLMLYIAKYLKDKLKPNRVSLTLGGCIYHLVVRCLDFMDFGLIQMAQTLPRIYIWKGELIKLFSDMAIGKNGIYGSRPIKEVDTCYACDAPGRSVSFDRRVLKDSIDSVVGNYVSVKVKEDIITAFETHMKNQPLKSCNRAHLLILDVTRHLTGVSESMDTLKLDESEDTQLQNVAETISTSNSKRTRAEDDEEVETSKRPRTVTQGVPCCSKQPMGPNNNIHKGAATDKVEHDLMNKLEVPRQHDDKEHSVIQRVSV